ncbi:helix-turn-helix domain-containing protein [Tepidiphilus sp. HLB4]
MPATRTKGHSRTKGHPLISGSVASHHAAFLEQLGGDKKTMAARLGIRERTLYRKLG